MENDKKKSNTEAKENINNTVSIIYMLLQENKWISYHRKKIQNPKVGIWRFLFFYGIFSMEFIKLHCFRMQKS